MLSMTLDAFLNYGAACNWQTLMLRACIDTLKLPSISLGKMAQAQITYIEIKSHTILEIAAGMHSSRFIHNLADFSVVGC